MKKADIASRLTSAVLCAPKAAMALGLAVFLSGCMSLENEEGRLPDAMRTAMTSLSARGYPDLTKIPDAPTNLPSTKTWTAVEAGLVSQGRALAQNPTAIAPTSEETNVGWAERERAALEADPRAQIPPPLTPGAEGTPEWAAAAKAKLDADIARLPPA